MSDLRIKKIDEKDLDTILAGDIDFQGMLSFEKPLMIKGHFNGEIEAEGDLFIGEDAVVEAKITANKVSVRGKVKGNIYALSYVELFSSAVVIGDIISPCMEMEKGCQFNGHCIMNKKKNNDQNGDNNEE